jgi:extradiol dioxygenase family protein
MTRFWIDATIHFKPSGETEYQVNRNAEIWLEYNHFNSNIRIHTDDASENQETKLPHYQLVLPLEDPEHLREFADQLKEEADKIESGEYESEVEDDE